MNATTQTVAAAAAGSKPSVSIQEFECPLREQVSFAYQGYIEPLPKPRTPRVGETVIAAAFLEAHRSLGVVIVAGVILEEVTRSGQASEYAVRDHINGKVYFTHRAEMRRIAPFVPSASIPMFMPTPGGGSRLKTRSEKMLWLIDDLRAAGVTPSRYR
jgi:hypothetical protein